MAAVNAVGRAAGLESLEPIRDDRAGDLYERHSRRVYAYCLSRLARREDAEDAVQTTFLHAVNGLRRGVTPSHELAWLLGIARNVCLTRIESAGRRRRLELVCDPVDLERSEAPRGRRDELIGLEHALARLPEQQRRAVLLRDWRGLSYEEVAAQLGVSLANAETLIFRGRRTLAELLQEEPSAMRRRLASLGHLGSLFTWAKSTVTGAAAGAKLAAAVAVVAVAGGGVVAGSAAPRQDQPAAPTVPASAATSGAPSARQPSHTSSRGVPAPADATARPQTGATPRTSVPTERGPTPRTAGDTVSQAGLAPPAAVEGSTAAPPAARDPLPAVTETVGSVVDDVGANVAQVVPPLAPVVEEVVDPVVEPVVAVVESVPVPDVAGALTPVVETAVASVPPVAPPVPVPLKPLP